MDAATGEVDTPQSGAALESAQPTNLGPLGLTPRTWGHLRNAAMVLYVLVTALYLRSAKAIPSDREIIAGWILGLALTATIGRTRKDVRTTLLSWLPFLLALFLYDFARALGHWIGAPLVVRPQIAVDRWLGGGRLWTERLQEWLVSPKAGLGRLPLEQSEQILKKDGSTIRWYDVMVSGIYQSHFLIPYLTAGILWRRRTRWQWYAATFVAVNFASCAVFTAVATAPPWYAAREGLIAPFPRVLAARGWSRIGLHFASRVIEKGQGTVNPFAAIPSLHSAQSMIVVVFLWGITWKWIRPLLLIYPLGMAFTLVYTGEHYLIDVLVGWGMVALMLTIGWWLRQRKGWPTPFLRWATPATPTAPAAPSGGSRPTSS